MGSVYVTWQGTCSERKRREDLVEHMRLIAERNVDRLALLEDDISPEKTAAAAAAGDPFAQRKLLAPRIEPVRLFDTEITGKILVVPNFVLSLEALNKDAEKDGVEKINLETGGAIKSEPGCLSFNSEVEQWCLRLNRLKLYGIDFQLFDYRDLYPGANRLSFVFIESSELPSLNGCLVQVEAQKQCQAYGSEIIRDADWLLTTPSIHLRYFLEEWTDFLLSWVKYFFVEDLYFWRYEEFPSYESFKEKFEMLRTESGIEAAKEVVLREVIDSFDAATNISD